MKDVPGVEVLNLKSHLFCKTKIEVVPEVELCTEVEIDAEIIWNLLRKDLELLEKSNQKF